MASLHKKYAAIPTSFWPYYAKLCSTNTRHPLLRATQIYGEQSILDNIDKLFRITLRNTGLEKKELFSDLSFDRNNLDDDHLQSIFGVMRAINILSGIGFSNLRPLRPKKRKRESDLVGEKNGEKYAIEVFRSNERAYRFPDHHRYPNSLQRYIAKRYLRDKRLQLESTMRTYKCQKALLAVVMDSQPAKALVAGSDWNVVAKKTFELMKTPTNTQLFIFTGMSDIDGKDEFIFYPTFI